MAEWYQDHEKQYLTDFARSRKGTKEKYKQKVLCWTIAVG